MFRQVLMDLKRSVQSVRLFYAILLCALIYVIGSIPEQGATDITYLLDASVGFNAFSHLFPLVGTLPLAGSFLQDRKSGYIKFELQRVNKTTYLLSRFISVMLAGGVATGCGMILFLILAPVLHPYAQLPSVDAEPIYEYMTLLVRDQQWIAYFGFYVLLQSLSGMMWAAIGVMMSAIVNDEQLIYIAVVLSEEIICQMLFALGKQHIVLYAMGDVKQETIAGALAESGGVFLSLIAVCFGIYCLTGRRRIKNV